MMLYKVNYMKLEEIYKRIKYKPKVEEVYPLTEFSLRRNKDDGFILVDFVKCEKPKDAIIPEGVF